MVHGIVTAVTLAFLSAIACAEVDFSPRESFYLAEATKVPNVAFRNGKEDITYSPPNSWGLSGGGRRLTLTPPNTPQAEAVMQTSPVLEPVPATDANLKAYTEFAVRQLPREAAKVTVADASISSLRIARQDMVEVTLTYALYGQQFSTNMLFLPYNKEQILFQITARTADFPALSKAFRSSLYSMQGFEAKQ